MTHPKYRPDIDGLRALAVILVIGFHAFPEAIPGGFVGVDVFFVISGFLITTIVVRSIDKGNFSFAEFYVRRIRRIFPALATVLCFSCVCGWFLLLPDEFKQLGKNIAGASAFVANILLWRESGYFDDAAAVKPLLHLWSLGVEEQFYILFPFAIWLTRRSLFVTLALVIGVGIVSYALDIVELRTDPSGAFYLPWARFWELMIGALLAVVLGARTTAERNWSSMPFVRNVLSGCGLALILAGAFLITESQPFPGWRALIPTCGTALVIMAGAPAWPNRRLLAAPILVGIGLISFPLYLWHWVLLAFPRVIEGATLPVVVRIGAVCAAFVLAWLTYVFVERPFRSGDHAFAKTSALASIVGTIGVFGLICFLSNGVPSRGAAQPVVQNEGDIKHVDFHKYPYGRFYLCRPPAIEAKALRYEGMVRCFQSKDSDRIDMALVGDSHAEHFFIGLAEAIPGKNIAYYTQPGLPTRDNALFRDIIQFVAADKDIKTVVVSSYWAMNDYRFDALADTLERFSSAGKKILILDDVPNFSFDPAKCKFSRRLRVTNECAESRANFAKLYAKYEPKLEKIAAAVPGAQIVHSAKYLCDDKVCSMGRNGLLLYRDVNHLNINGSKLLGKLLVRDNPDLSQ